MAKANLNTLYVCIKQKKKDIARLDESFKGHPDHDRVLAFERAILESFRRDYINGGGKREV